MNGSKRNIVAGLGESLFDCFAPADDSDPSSEVLEIMGGAPLNAALMAAYLGQPFGLRAQMISRVGRDPLGDQIGAALHARGIDTSTLQVDPQVPTGRVNVKLVQGEPQYDIQTNVAWDRLQWNNTLEKLAPQLAGVTFGTLAQRSATSRRTIQRLLQSAPHAVKFFDVNLRQHYFSADLIRECCELADAIKLNQSELEVVSQLLGIEPSAAVDQLRMQFSLQAIVLTHGAQGTELITASGRYRAEVPRYASEPMCDPVGAGDACGAACLIGLCLQWPPDRIVRVANRMGAWVASRRGATPELDEDTLQQQILKPNTVPEP